MPNAHESTKMDMSRLMINGNPGKQLQRNIPHQRPAFSLLTIKGIGKIGIESQDTDGPVFSNEIQPFSLLAYLYVFKFETSAGHRFFMLADSADHAP